MITMSQINAEENQTLWIELSGGFTKLDNQNQIYKILSISDSRGNTTIRIRQWRKDLGRWHGITKYISETPMQIVEIIKEAKEAQQK